MLIRPFCVPIAALAIASFAWASETDELRERAQAMRREAAELARHGHRQEAENLERKALAILEEAERLQPTREDAIGRRLEHMHLAVRHLNQAGLPDLAEQVARRAEAVRHSRPPQDAGAIFDEMMTQLRELQRQVSRLNDEVAELKRNR